MFFRRAVGPVLSCLLLAGLFPGVARSTLVAPECAGEPATRVLVAPGTADEYDFGPDVDVQDDSDGLFMGTEGRDVMVALVPTGSGGFVSDPKRFLEPYGAGDLMCGSNGDDIFYNGPGGDAIYAGGGDDLVYGGGGPDIVYAGPGVDRVWGFTVQAGQTQIVRGGDDQDHLYLGKGKGRVVAYGGSAPADVNGGGDHIHPCPVDSAGGDIEAYGIEYVGREDAFTDQAFDPCASGARSLT